MGEKDADDFQELLPPEMRSGWAVVPRFFLYQLCAVGALLGAGAAVNVLGWIYGHNWMRWAFPVAMLIAYLQNRLLSRRETRVVASARRAAANAAARSDHA